MEEPKCLLRIPRDSKERFYHLDVVGFRTLDNAENKQRTTADRDGINGL